jgi:hypothetical protein
MTSEQQPTKRGRKPKFTAAECQDIKEWYAKDKESISTTARIFRTTPATISKIIDGRYKPSVLAASEEEDSCPCDCNEDSYDGARHAPDCEFVERDDIDE